MGALKEFWSLRESFGKFRRYLDSPREFWNFCKGFGALGKVLERLGESSEYFGVLDCLG